MTENFNEIILIFQKPGGANVLMYTTSDYDESVGSLVEAFI